MLCAPGPSTPDAAPKRPRAAEGSTTLLAALRLTRARSGQGTFFLVRAKVAPARASKFLHGFGRTARSFPFLLHEDERAVVGCEASQFGR